ncbi:MAG: transcription antitermination factor NusB [Gammaproteobacteria bacterium]|nr:transcription antitermination factor NusB [Gammaproteobacteria bacterium]|tara:strand:+ start:32489 stop:32887 length:399 start_codon:yes stop_codon:yes gene_type:complete
MNNKQRSLARENIVKILYQQDISGDTFVYILKYFIEKRKYDEIYFLEMIDALDNNLLKIDKFIESKSDIKLKYTASIDKAILRLSICEHLYKSDIPRKVIIDEGINIAKKFSSEKSFKFINKMLDNLIECKS